jgi:hypothetical protein
MTICVSVNVAEGLVFAADSQVTLTRSQTLADGQITTSVYQTFNYANKITHFKNYPIGVMSWGLANLQQRSIQSLILELENEYASLEEDQEYSVETIAKDIADFVGKRYQDTYSNQTQITPPERSLGMLIGGYAYEEFFPTQYAVQFENSNDLVSVRSNDDEGMPQFGASWYGMTDALFRLIRGYDIQALTALINRGVNVSIVNEWIEAREAELPLVFDGMPLQDAIDFAEYCIQVVIGRYRFGAGIPLCGGDVDIAVIRPRQFTWARRKQWSLKE